MQRRTHRPALFPRVRQWLNPAALFLPLLLVILPLSGCATSPSILRPAGPGAARINDLWWIMFAMATVVFVVVEGLLIYATVRFGRNRPPGEPRQVYGNTLVEAGWTSIPAVILAVLFVFTLRTMAVLKVPATNPTLAVQVIGHQWWWEVRYPGEHIVTANEIHIPVGQMVPVQLNSADVIHSFWVPELQGKLDVIPGHTNVTWLEASQPGTYRGQCAEFCGVQHAHMAFLVIADPPDQYARWVASEQAAAVAPTAATARHGMDVFMASACVGCHTIQGTKAQGKIGPDLTHVASRDTIAADTLTNTPANLTAWIHDPQGIKPGNDMPDLPLSPSDVQAIVAYLQTLH